MHSRKGRRNSTWKSLSTSQFLLQTELTEGSCSALALLPPLHWYMQELERFVLSKAHLLNSWEGTPLISWGCGMSFAFPLPALHPPAQSPRQPLSLPLLLSILKGLSYFCTSRAAPSPHMRSSQDVREWGFPLPQPFLASRLQATHSKTPDRTLLFQRVSSLIFQLSLHLPVA